MGKIWDADTMAKIGGLCKKYGVVVVSDEIHCDLTRVGRGYTPFASVSEECRMNSITCIAPTKSFNYLSSGKQFGKGGEHFLRMNIACPKQRLSDEPERLEKALK